MKYPRPPRTPDEIRATQGRTAERRKAEEDRAAADFASQLGGDPREKLRLRQREMNSPGYTEARARQLDEEKEKNLQAREGSLERQLANSIAYYGEDKPAALKVPTDEPLAPTGGVTPKATQAPKPAAAAAPSDTGGGALADVPWRKRRVAPQKMTRAGEGGLSRLLGI